MPSDTGNALLPGSEIRSWLKRTVPLNRFTLSPKASSDNGETFSVARTRLAYSLGQSVFCARAGLNASAVSKNNAQAKPYRSASLRRNRLFIEFMESSVDQPLRLKAARFQGVRDLPRGDHCSKPNPDSSRICNGT